MKITVTEFYLQPSVYFNISYKVYNYLDKCINAEINKIKTVKENPLELTIVVDSRRIKKTKISPSAKYGRRSNEKKIVIVLPYALKKEGDLYTAFLKHLCRAMNTIFSGYDVTDDVLRQIETRCMKEIPGNKKYEYKEEG